MPPLANDGRTGCMCAYARMFPWMSCWLCPFATIPHKMHRSRLACSLYFWYFLIEVMWWAWLVTRQHVTGESEHFSHVSRFTCVSENTSPSSSVASCFWEGCNFRPVSKRNSTLYNYWGLHKAKTCRVTNSSSIKTTIMGGLSHCRLSLTLPLHFLLANWSAPAVFSPQKTQQLNSHWPFMFPLYIWYIIMSACVQESCCKLTWLIK